MYRQFRDCMRAIREARVRAYLFQCQCECGLGQGQGHCECACECACRKQRQHLAPSLKALPSDVQQFAVDIICKHTNWDEYDLRTAHAKDSSATATPPVKFGELETQLHGTAITWRMVLVTTNFDVELPKATVVMAQMLLELCGKYSGDTCTVLSSNSNISSGRCEADYLHENMSMWLIYLCNISDAVVELSNGTRSATGIGWLLHNETDHVHNGFRRLGSVNATELTRKGYYYCIMQPCYISQYTSLLQLLRKEYRDDTATIDRLVALSQKFISRYRCMWDYQEQCRNNEHVLPNNH